MPVWDYECKKCNLVEERRFVNDETAKLFPPQHCGQAMTRRQPSPNFRIEGYNAGNGYARHGDL